MQGMRASPYRDIYLLLHHDPIRIELELDDQVYEEIAAGDREVMDKVFGLRDSSLSREELAQQITEILDGYGAKAFESLSEEKTQRLEGLYAQLWKSSAAANKRIADRIGLEGESLEAFRSELEDLRREMWDEIGPLRRRLFENPNLDREDVRKKLERLVDRRSAEIEQKLSARLTAQQRENLESLKGEPFAELPDPNMWWPRLDGRRRDGRRDSEEDDQRRRAEHSQSQPGDPADGHHD
jgi:hypothetical protein